MPYVGSDGTMQQSKPFGLTMIMDAFWGTVAFVNLFFRSLFHLDDGGPQQGTGGRAPRMPGRRMGGVGRMGGVAPPPCVGGG
ncbi:Selenoprotein K [Orchesella cincta]|uniref:Selenoprotein K n=1 Tax=Orchesella cincta TaxID=48709 RepID=A0A1D2N601_ORCCI|nr:Selenoprotein K [Orchesella cincta]